MNVTCHAVQPDAHGIALALTTAFVPLGPIVTCGPPPASPWEPAADAK